MGSEEQPSRRLHFSREPCDQTSPRDGFFIAVAEGDAGGVDLLDAEEEVAHGFVDCRLVRLMTVHG